jgi:hypothetical protein
VMIQSGEGNLTQSGEGDLKGTPLQGHVRF